MQCPGCGKQFQQKRSNQIRCAPNCGRSNTSKNGARAKSHKSNTPTIFVGIDGEAVYNGESFDYCLLSVGENTLHHNGTGLTDLDEIFSFLYGEYLYAKETYPSTNVAFVGFFLSFDFTHWLKLLSEERARVLLTKAGIAKRQRKKNPALGPFPVYWNGWEFDLLGDKRFKLRPQESKDGWMNICDAGPFFQTSLLNAANPKKWPSGTIDPRDYELVLEGKSKRGNDVFGQELIDYNLAENRILAAMLGEYERGLRHIDIKLNKNQWFGPGQASSKWLNTTSIPLNKTVKQMIPEDCIKAAQASYYGGRFEVFQHGHIPGTTYEYDINSAYPNAMLKLPDITHGEWHYSKTKSYHRSLFPVFTNELKLVHGFFYRSHGIMGALPHRTKQGRIYYPLGVSGWYWQHEIEAAYKLGLIERLEIYEAWAFCPDSDSVATYPLQSIRELYHLRQSIGKETSEGKALKLIYNAAYGKTSQSIGNPKFSNPFYASLITSYCRTQILDAIRSHPCGEEDIVMIATDGIYLNSPHPYLPISENLGEWSADKKENLTTFLPGIYWDDKARAAIKDGNSVSFKSRGISARDLAQRIDELDQQFSELRTKGIFPNLELPIAFTYLSLRQGLIGRNPLDDTKSRWEDVGKPLSGKFKKINAYPGEKRDTSNHDESCDTVRFFAKPYPEEPSHAYEKSFGMFDLADDEILNQIASDDAPDIGKHFANILTQKY